MRDVMHGVRGLKHDEQRKLMFHTTTQSAFFGQFLAIFVVQEDTELQSHVHPEGRLHESIAAPGPARAGCSFFRTHATLLSSSSVRPVCAYQTMTCSSLSPLSSQVSDEPLVVR